MKLFDPSSVLPVVDDTELMERVRQGDREAFRLLYERYKNPVMSMLFSIVQNTSTAEELFQETFLKLYRAREQYEPRAKFSTFLWTIAKRTAWDWCEKKKEVLTLNRKDAEDELREGILENLESPLPSAEAELIDRMEEAKIQDCLSQLPLLDRTICSLRIHSELSYEEISQEVQLPLATVKTRLHRAKQKLVHCFRAKGEGR